MTLRPLSHLSEIIDDFDLFLVDQFGVLHDGQSVLPGALTTLNHLINSEKTVIVITNSGKRATYNEARMTKMGFPRNAYSHLVSSGEVTRTILQESRFSSQSRCFLIASGSESNFLDGLELTQTSDPLAADLILITGGEGDRYPEEYYRQLLKSAAAKHTPCICSNPDMISLLGDLRYFGPGRIAQIYEEMGGSVRYIGKPHPEIYHQAASLAGSIAAERTLCIGDSIEHDIAGATAAGFKSLLITDGILRGLDLTELNRLCNQHQALATYRMPQLSL